MDLRFILDSKLAGSELQNSPSKNAGNRSRTSDAHGAHVETDAKHPARNTRSSTMKSPPFDAHEESGRAPRIRRRPSRYHSSPPPLSASQHHSSSTPDSFAGTSSRRRAPVRSTTLKAHGLAAPPKHGSRQSTSVTRRPSRQVSASKIPPGVSSDDALSPVDLPKRNRLIRHSGSLSQVRRSVEAEKSRLGRKVSIMDFVLDSMSPFADYSEEVLAEIAIRSQCWSNINARHNQDYEFSDPQSLRDYWADQSVVFKLFGAHVSTSSSGGSDASNTTFPESVERSTASWQDPLEKR